MWPRPDRGADPQRRASTGIRFGVRIGLLRSGIDTAVRQLHSTVMDENVVWWGARVWDAFALPHLVSTEPAPLVATRCPGCGTALAWMVGGDRDQLTAD